MKSEKENRFIDIFNEQAKNGDKTYNLFNFYYYQYDIIEIKKILELYEIPYNMESIQDSTIIGSYGNIDAYRSPNYMKNYVKVYILEKDYTKSLNMLDEIIEKYTNKDGDILDGMVIFYMEN